jgi:hypothetical protein
MFEPGDTGMPTIDIVVDGLTDQQISELEKSETNGICSLEQQTDDLHGPGDVVTLITTALENLPVLAVLLVAWKLRVKIVRKKKDGTSTHIEVDLGNNALDPKAAAALMSSAADEPPAAA